MHGTQITLVYSQVFSVDISTVSATMKVRTKRDKVLVFVFLRFFPRINMMNIDIYVSTSRNRTSVTCLDQDFPPDISGDRRTPSTGFFRHNARSKHSSDSCGPIPIF